MEDMSPKENQMSPPADVNEPRRAGPPQRGREPYQPPAIESEEIFETSALACGKTSPTQSSCQAVPKSS